MKITAVLLLIGILLILTMLECYKTGKEAGIDEGLEEAIEYFQQVIEEETTEGRMKNEN